MVSRGRVRLLVVTVLVLASVLVESAGKTGVGDRRIHPKPAVARAPLKAGETLADPTFGTTIVRVTDPSTAPDGASVNSAATDSMFNADGTRFYLHHQKAGTHLYSLDPGTGEVSRLGQLPRSPSGTLAYDGAPWDPRDPQVLYAVVPSPTRRELWQITLPLPGTLTLLHDFSQEVPTGGYPSSRVQVSPDGRSFAVLASTTGGQDTYDHVVVWDRQSGQSRVLHTPTRLGKTLHGIFMDGSGEYLILSLVGGGARHIWHWPSDTLETITTGSPDYFKGHISPGTGEVLNPGPEAGSWLRRSLATPHTFTELLRYPRKDGKGDWFQDSHTSRLLRDGSFITTRYVGSFAWGTFTLHAGAVYTLAGYKRDQNFDTPEAFRYRGLPLQRVQSLPTAPNQWAYDAAADTLYVWLPDSADPQANRKAISIFDWRPLMEEIVQVFKDSSGAWTWRRLAHHRSQWTGAFESSPRGNAAPTGTAVLFQSNWDGSPRTDAFLLVVPKR